MKAVITLSVEWYESMYESILKRTPPGAALYSGLMNAVSIRADRVVVLCSPNEGSMLLNLAEQVCPAATSEIERAMRVFDYVGR
jgi:hypothetical protein